MNILLYDIGDKKNNVTRFILVTKTLEVAGFHNKCSIVCSPKINQSGALYDILHEFAIRGIGLSKIESRPKKDLLGEYVFYIDLEGNIEDELIKEAFYNVENITENIKSKWQNWFEMYANYLKKEHALDIIFAGDETDNPMVSRMQAALDFKSYSVANSFSLSAFGALCKQAQVFLGNESGPLHIAAASGCSVLGLFGPGEPKVFYPWGAKAHFLHEVLECNPCDQINCKYPDNTCMDRISVAAVQEKLNQIISQ